MNDKISMSRLDEVELVVTNNLARARARMASSNYNCLSEEVEIQNVQQLQGTEDDHLLSPRRVKRGCCSRLWSWCCGPKDYASRTVWIGRENVQKLTGFYAITFIAQNITRTGRHVTIKRSAIKSDRSFDTKCHANIDR